MVVTVNRPAIVYGPGDLRMLKLFKAILRRRFVMVGSGEVKAHLGYIEDQVDSLILCAIAPRAKVHLEAFNIASDQTDHPERAGPTGRSRWQRDRCRSGMFRYFPCGWPAACEAIWAPFKTRPPLSRRRVGFFTHNRAFDLTKAREHLGYVSRWDNRDGNCQDDRLVSRDEADLIPARLSHQRLRRSRPQRRAHGAAPCQSVEGP